MAAGFILVFLLARETYAVEHVVGGGAGWAPMVDYAKWAAGETFHIGDTLRFNYYPIHAVNQVTLESYTTCATNNSITANCGGSTTIKLKEVGPMFFICPVPGHCASGRMKLSIIVLAGAGNTTIPTTPTPPRTTTPRTPTPPGTTTPRTPTPPCTTTPTTPKPPCTTKTPATLTPLTIPGGMTLTPPTIPIITIYPAGSCFVEANYLTIVVSLVLAMVVGFMGL